MIPHKPERAVLVVAELNEDYCHLRRMLSQSNWASDWASTYAEAIIRLQTKEIPIVICEHKLLGGLWSDFIQEARAAPDPPLVIVAAAQGYPSLFDEVRSLGGIDVLTRPFERYEVLEVLSNSRREWHRRVNRNESS